MAFGAVEKFSWRGEVFNDFTGNNEIKLLVESEISRIRTHHVKAFSPQRFDRVIFVIQSHQMRRLFAKNAVEPVFGVACFERVVDATNVQDPFALGKFSYESGSAEQHIN